eukprot:PLAT4132.1.p1 GENE.PLAT4132.1~~PLAT4132.1.p1  ORF type:complete len:533 (+),score=270.33 PLAT4132.1:31-1599(+)
MAAEDSIDLDALRATYEAAGQAHVFKYLDAGKCSDEEKAALLKQLAAVDVERVGRAYSTTLGGAAAGDGAGGEDGDAPALAPPEEVASVAALAEDAAAKLRGSGYAAMAAGEVGLLLLSGGQATRLGSPLPKGMYDIGLPSGRTLFELQAASLRKSIQLAREATGQEEIHVPWYVMTSPLNHEVTKAYFAEQGFFGLPEEDISFFSQGTLPCMTEEGKFILKSRGELATAPDGNGGIYQALLTTGTFADMKARGVKYLHAFCVDNALVKVADALFLGYCIDAGAEAGAKVVAKRGPHEKVGVMARRYGKYGVVEYSEIDAETAELTDDDGKLVYNAGNICVHFFTVDFLDRVLSSDAFMLTYHVARKKIPCAAGEEGDTVKPVENNGIKLEMFIFDVFALASSMAVLEVAREAEFSPVKNSPLPKDGHILGDSPHTARLMVSTYHRSLLEAAGATIAVADDWQCTYGQPEGTSISCSGAELVCEATGFPNPAALVELSLETTYAGEGLERFAGVTVKAPCCL